MVFPAFLTHDRSRLSGRVDPTAGLDCPGLPHKGPNGLPRRNHADTWLCLHAITAFPLRPHWEIIPTQRQQERTGFLRRSRDLCRVHFRQSL